MFARILNRLIRKQDPERSRSLGDALLQLLDEHAVLTVDRKLLHMLKTSQREFFRVVYALVIRESMYMMADVDGKVILMTNAEFTRFMMRRSTTRETEIRRRDGSPAAPMAAESRLAVAVEESAPETARGGFGIAVAAAEGRAVGEILCTDTETALFTGATLGGAPLDGVLAITSEVSDSEDSAAANTVFPAHLMQGEAGSSGEQDYGWLDLGEEYSRNGENVPDGRQSLPGRRREAWLVAEPVGGKGK